MVASSPAAKNASSPATPAAATPKMGKRGLLAMYPGADSIPLPKPKKSGNRIADDDAASVHSCFEDLVSVCNLRREHVMPLWFKLQDRVVADMETEAAQAQGAILFEKPMGALRGMDEEWLLDWIVKRSGMSVTKLMNAKRQDPETVFQLASMELQLSLQFRLGEGLRLKEVCYITFNKRAEDMGGRLKKFVAAAGTSPFCKNGQVDWKFGCYALQFDKQKLVKVTHRSSGAVADVSTESFTADWILEHNWSDSDAQLRKGKFPPVKVALFFDEKEKEGPHANPAMKAKSKSWQQLVEECTKQFEEESARLRQGTTTQATVKAELQKVRDEQKKSSMDKAREKAKEMLVERRGKRQVSFKAKASAASSAAP